MATRVASDEIGCAARTLGPRILFATAEFEDFVKVGGLGVVSSVLPRVLSRQADVRVVLPGYRQVLSQCGDFRIIGGCASLAEIPACEVARVKTRDGLTLYILICPSLYDRDGNPYADRNGRDWADNDLRFARLSLAAAELATGRVDTGWKADLLHANDWPTGLAPAYLNWRQADIPSIMTIHNLAYQGLFPRENIDRIGAPESAFRMDGVEFYDQLSFLKAGVYYASHVTTVSANYARQVTTPQYGCGLDGLLRTRAAEHRLTGILNGIDEGWDPRTCVDLTTRFEPGDWKGKRLNRNSVRSDLGLKVSRGPLFGLVARLVHQKGVDLVNEAADAIVQAGGQIAIMGTGEHELETAARKVATRHRGSVAVKIGYDEGQSRRLFAGSDFILIPSRFEPCGLTQMQAQRFGALPIAHRTGGLAETIDDGKTGFLFGEPTIASFLGAVVRAFSIFHSKPKLNSMRLRAMSRRFDWRPSAERYDDLYRRVIGNRPRAPSPRSALASSVGASAGLVATP